MRVQLAKLVEAVNAEARTDQSSCELLALDPEGTELERASGSPRIILRLVPTLTNIVRQSPDSKSIVLMRQAGGELRLAQADNGLVSALVIDPYLQPASGSSPVAPTAVEVFPRVEPAALGNVETISVILDKFMMRVMSKHWAYSPEQT
ncbi:hypothetical protein D7Y27_22550 [Corallococcus sp. AB004]|nr:hypothetical protein D7Y27_22550 [Corallococcus sp. AB004]